MVNNVELLKYIRKGSVNAIKALSHPTKCNQSITISANIMVKDEERCIRRCIESVVSYVDEINIVDTGSTDKTLTILYNLQKRWSKINIYNHIWTGNFSEIRNYMLSVSSGEAIFMLDADESLSHNITVSEFRNIISQIFLSTDNNILISPILYDADGTSCDTLARIYRNDSSIYYFGCVHEELRSSIYKSFEFISTNITLYHDGYNSTQVISKDKIRRNIQLLKKTYNMEKYNYRWSFFLIRDLYSGKMYSQELLNLAYECLKKISTSDKSVIEYRKQSYLYIALIFLKFEKFQDLKNVIDVMYSLYPADIDCFYVKLQYTKAFSKHIVSNLIDEYHTINRLDELNLIFNIDFDTIVMDLFRTIFYNKEYEKSFLLLSELKSENQSKLLEEVKKLSHCINKELLKCEDPDFYFKDILNPNCIISSLK